MNLTTLRHIPIATLYVLFGHTSEQPASLSFDALRASAQNSALALDAEQLPHGRFKALGLYETVMSYDDIVGSPAVDDAITGSRQWVIDYDGIWLGTIDRVNEQIRRHINSHQIAALDAGTLNPDLEAYLDGTDPQWQSVGRRRWLQQPRH